MDVLRLKQYREMSKMTQRDVSSALNITQAAYWKWEKGKSSPNANQILNLCELFNCSPNDLFGFKGVYKLLGAELDGDI